MDVNLVMFKKNGSQKVFPMPSSITVIGRRPDCDLCVPLASVSKRHCQLNYDGGLLHVRDLSSRNGTYLNGKRVDEAVIKAGDSIEIGRLTFVFQINGQPEAIVQPEWVAQSPPQQDATTEDTADMPTDDTTDEEFEDFAELEDLDSLEDLNSLDESGSS